VDFIVIDSLEELAEVCPLSTHEIKLRSQTNEQLAQLICEEERK
jgi:hypothetical protein